MGKRAGKPHSGGLACEDHIVAHCVRKEEGYSYAELVDRISLIPEVCDRLGVHPDAPPDPSTFHHSSDCYAMYIWWALLRISAHQHPQSGRVALNSMFFEREQTSQPCLQRCGRSVKTIETTTLTDTEPLAVLDVHCCIEREHDTKAGPRGVVADNGFQDWNSEYEVAVRDIGYLVHYRGSSMMATANNALIRSKSYTQR